MLVVKQRHPRRPSIDWQVGNLRIAPARNGLGLFAARAYRAGDDILRLAGRIVHYELLWERGGTFADNCIRFGPNTYLDPADHPGRYINHSCEPNAAIRKERNQLFVFAIARIRRGAELTFDYSTTIGDDDIWTMRCNCGAPSCRSRVRRFGTLPRQVRESYLARGAVPGCIVATLS
ncbi:MAG TPA: SET domain-containing protein-lysine N-methyltransferase [Gemmatimonadaceae bacterium]|nr:SET domain-containing protein-lysine N-methyltransferase [Gemmatimonadaceae bacterium]